MVMFYREKVQDVMAHFETSPDGLSKAEAAKRLAKNGKNLLPQKPTAGIVAIFVNEFRDPLVLLLLVAIVVSLFVGEYIDAIVILAIVLVDAIMGTYQENRANKTADALSKLVPDGVNVIRGGMKIEVPAEDLVLGDYVLLESGDRISADVRLAKTQNFRVDESILTGESVQVDKIHQAIHQDRASIGDRRNMAFAGTTVVSGRAEGVVVATGINTELGHIADSLNTTEEEKSPLTLRVEKLSKQISALVLVIAIIITVLLISKQMPYNEIILTVIAFAVSAMPEGLPLALTMALTIASNRMAKRNVVVRRLHAAESLGSCTVIASDKTGTLTVNQQTAKRIILPDGSHYEVSGTGYELAGKVTGKNLAAAAELGLLGVINNEASIDGEHPAGDAVDIAFLVLGHKLGVSTRGIDIVEQIPYESENKYSAVFYRRHGKTRCTVKGSLEVVMDFCAKPERELLIQQNEQLAAEGYRVIALADGEVSDGSHHISDIKKLKFVGMVAFIDPIRKEAVASIRDCHQAGIKVLMITGDHPLTAAKIGRDLKLIKHDDEVATGDDVAMQLAIGNEEQFGNFVAQKTVFARVTPLQKLEIIKALKRRGEFVAVTGDGVNDAPALKAANIGIAMGSGTDIARETADMIIMDDNFKSIVAGIEEGRVAYSNIRKIILFLISCGLAEATFFVLAIMFDMPMPLVAVQLLWLNVVTDGIQDFALSFERAEGGILKEPPRDPHESIFDKSLLFRIVISGATIAAIVFGAWCYFINVAKFDAVTARSYIMCLMVFIQNIHVFNCRSERYSAFSVPLRSNWLIIFGVIGSILLQVIVMNFAPLSALLQTISLPAKHGIGLFGLALMILALVEIYKQIAQGFKNRH